MGVWGRCCLRMRLLPASRIRRTRRCAKGVSLLHTRSSSVMTRNADLVADRLQGLQRVARRRLPSLGHRRATFSHRLLAGNSQVPRRRAEQRRGSRYAPPVTNRRLSRLPSHNPRQFGPPHTCPPGVFREFRCSGRSPQNRLRESLKRQTSVRKRPQASGTHTSV